MAPFTAKNRHFSFLFARSIRRSSPIFTEPSALSIADVGERIECSHNSSARSRTSLAAFSEYGVSFSP